MNKLPQIGKYLFLIPMAVFGLFHFTNGSAMAGMVPSWLPGGIMWVYLVGVGLILAVVATIIDKQAKMALLLLGIMLLCFVLFIHLPALIGGDQMSMAMVLKDTGLAGGAFILSGQMKS